MDQEAISNEDRQAEKTLLGHHQKLWHLLTELLVPGKDGDDGREGERYPGDERAQEIVDELQVTRNQLDEFWSTRRKAQEAFLAQKKAEQETYRLKIKEELRDRYLSETMEAYADELDALRKDPGFRGTQDDMTAIIGMLEEGQEGLNADERTQSLYRDYMGGGGRGMSSAEASVLDGQPQILDEPVHTYMRRKDGLLMTPSVPSSSSSATAVADDDDDDDEAEGRGGGGGGGSMEVEEEEDDEEELEEQEEKEEETSSSKGQERFSSKKKTIATAAAAAAKGGGAGGGGEEGKRGKERKKEGKVN